MRPRRLTTIALALFSVLALAAAAGCTLSSGSQYEIDTSSTTDLYLTLYQVPSAEIAVYIYQNACGGHVDCTEQWLKANVTVPGSWSFLGQTVTAEQMWTLGLDYTFGAHVYTNVQWVHGLVDEFGAGDFFHQGWSVRQSGVSTVGAITNSTCVIPKDGTKCAQETLLPRLGDYLVLGADFKFLEDAGLFRLFTIWALSGVTTSAWDDGQGKRVMDHFSLFTKEGFSAAIFPELDYNFGNGLELGAGALLLLGRDYTKFGDPAAGGSLVFTRGRYSF